MSLTVFLLCAGYGQRLRPLTERVPKPAIPFLGETAFAINARAARELNPDRVIANAHHLPEAIRAIADPLGIEVLFEAEILGTGGCLGNASALLGKTDRFLVHNADLIHGIDLAALFDEHLESGAAATLAGIRNPDVNTLSVAGDGTLLGVHGFRPFDSAPEAARLTFSGIAFYSREFLSFVSSTPEDVKPAWARAQQAGAAIRVVDCSRSPWHDFGSPQGLWEAARFRMESEGNFSHGYSDPGGETRPWVSNEAGAENLPAGLRNVLVLEQPADPIAAGLRDCVVGRDFRWPMNAGGGA